MAEFLAALDPATLILLAVVWGYAISQGVCLALLVAWDRWRR